MNNISFKANVNTNLAKIQAARMSDKFFVEKVNGQMLVDLRSQLTQAYVDMEMTQAEANTAARETMGLSEEEYGRKIADVAEKNAINMGNSDATIDTNNSNLIRSMIERWKNFFGNVKNAIANLKAWIKGEISFSDIFTFDEGEQFTAAATTTVELEVDDDKKTEAKIRLGISFYWCKY